MPNIKSALISRPLPPIRENSTLSISPRGAIPTRNPLDQSGGESSVSDSDSSDTEVSPISTVMQGILIGSAGQEVEARSAEELMASDVRGNTVDIAHSDEEKNKDRTERLLRPGGDAPSDDTAPLLASRPFPIRGAQVPRHEKSGKTKARESRATTKLRRMPETSSAEPSRPSGMQAINRAGSPGALSNEPNDEGNSGASEDQDEENGCCFNYMYCCAQSNRQMQYAQAPDIKTAVKQTWAECWKFFKSELDSWAESFHRADGHSFRNLDTNGQAGREITRNSVVRRTGSRYASFI